MKKKNLILSNFILKIIALITMTFDHIGFVLGNTGINIQLGVAFRLIGRLAFPIFALLIVEGVLHTKSYGKYALRLGIIASAISIAIIVGETTPICNGFEVREFGNIFIDLLLGSLCIYLLNQKKNWIKFLSILPFAFSIASSIASGYECVQCSKIVWIIPYFLRTMSGSYGVLLILGIYLGYLLADYLIKIIASGAYNDEANQRLLRNLFSILAIVIVNVLFIVLGALGIEEQYLRIELSIQLYSIFAGVLILLYSGKRGYNASWFKYGCYLYYPLHLLIIFLVASLLGL